MAIKYFNLSDGSLEFHEDKLIIFDTAKRNRISFLLLICVSLIYSISTAIKGYRQHENSLFYFGFVLTLFWLFALIIRRKDFFTVNNEIFLTDVSKVTFSKGKSDGCTIVKILTKNNRQRKIKIVQEDNQDFAFKNLLIEHQISIE